MKKRKLTALLCVILCICLSAGCSISEKIDGILTEMEDEQNPPNSSEEVGQSETGGSDEFEIVEESVEESAGQGAQVDSGQEASLSIQTLCEGIRGLTEDELGVWEAIGMNDGSIAALRSEQEEHYYYKALDAQDQLLYAELLMILQHCGEGIVVTATEGTEVDLAFQSVLADHPEIFYVKGYTYTKHLLNDAVQRISFTGTYTKTTQEIENAQSSIDRYVSQCLSAMPEGDDYTKIRYLYEYIINHTDYVLNSPENQNICSVFLYGQSVCQGYAKAFEYLCRSVGIEASLVTGTIRDSGYGHAWNLVYADGAYYYVDVTWGDASYTSDSTQLQSGYPSVNYDYLCVSTEQLSLTHAIDTVVPMPDCMHMDDNYYVREGAYFTALDTEGLSSVFENAKLYQDSFVTIKCSSEAVYKEFYDYLISQQMIFEYMNSDAGVSYYDNVNTMTFSFWLP